MARLLPTMSVPPACLDASHSSWLRSVIDRAHTAGMLSAASAIAVRTSLQRWSQENTSTRFIVMGILLLCHEHLQGQKAPEPR